MKKDEYIKERDKRIMKNWKGAMEDCQLPTGALACMGATDFYIYTLENRLNIIEYGGKIVHEDPIDSRILEYKKKIDETYKQFKKDVKQAEDDFYQNIGMFSLEAQNETK